jgi:PAS domain S-box-containing protein
MQSTLATRVLNPWKAYAVAVSSPFLALVLRMSLNPATANKIPYLMFFLAVALSAAYGGFGPGLAATILGFVLESYLFGPPLASLTSVADYVGYCRFLIVGVIVSYLFGRLLEANRSEKALRTLFQQTLTSIGDAVISTDAQQRVLFMNPMAESLTGWNQNDAWRHPIAEIFRSVQEGTDHPAEVPIKKILETGEVLGLSNHTELIHRNGQRIPIDDSGAAIRDAHGRTTGAVLVFRDISSRRRTERQLEVSERRARTILESITEAFVVLDPDWRYAAMNGTAERLMGVPAQSLIGKNHWELYPQTLGTQAEVRLRQAMQQRLPVHFEDHYEPTDQWFDVSAYPSSEGLAIYFRDITERKHAEQELRRLNEDLTHFTFAVTHDLREPLRMITIYSQLLEQTLADQVTDKQRLFMNQVMMGTKRITRLIDGLLQFSRTGAAEREQPAPVDMEAALQETLDALQVVIRESDAEITHEPLPQVLAGYTSVSQLLQNLIVNGLKYRNPDARPILHIWARREGSLWVVGIQDNGLGIAPEHRDRIFQPFQRLHGPEISGAGIGLAICKRTVERFRGRIWVDSREGKGSTFYFSFPAVD